MHHQEKTLKKITNRLGIVNMLIFILFLSQFLKLIFVFISLCIQTHDLGMFIFK